MTTRMVTQASTHPLSLLSTARPSFVFDTFLSGGLSKAAPTTLTTLSVGEVSAPSSDDVPVTTATQLTCLTTSPHRSLVATAIIVSLTDAVSTPASTPMSVPPSSTAAPPPTTPTVQSLTAVIPPVPLPAPPPRIETRPPQKPENATLPKELSMQPWGHGKGRGGWRGKGGQGGQGGRVAKENAADNLANANANTDPNIYQDGLLSPASCRRINILNKRVYAPDGSYHGPPLGASHSINADGLHPCVTFNGPPPTSTQEMHVGCRFRGRHCFRQTGKEGVREG